MDDIRNNTMGLAAEEPLFDDMTAGSASPKEHDIPESLDEVQGTMEEPSPVKEESSPEGEPPGTARKRHRSTKAEMEARRRAAAVTGENPNQEKSQAQEQAELSNIPIVEAVFRMGLELSCPKTKDQVDAGSGEHWSYRNVDDILCALKPLMRKYGVFVTFSTRIECIGELNYVAVEATARNLSGETFTTTSYAREDFVRPGNWAAQITGSCESYAKKYALQSMFMIDNGKLEAVDDPDATSNLAPRQPVAGREQAAQSVRDEKAGLRESIKPLLVRGCGDWMTRAADAANWNGTREEYARKVRRNYRISEDDLLILLSAIPESAESGVR